jgi:hypothetical protein
VKDPESTLGAPGDMFINTTTKTLFGPKDLTTSWPAGVSMVGPAGSGTAGATGATGAAGSNATLTCAQGGTCVVGNTGPGGGKVFYVQTATAAAPWRYMEAAPNTWSGGSEDPVIAWCSVVGETCPLLSSLTTGDTAVTTSTALGSGFRNTKIMLGSFTFPAANMAASYNGGGKSDWHLPSKDELNQLYSQKATVGGFVEGTYWSSTLDATNNAWCQIFTNSNQGFSSQLNSNYVRPVRAF